MLFKGQKLTEEKQGLEAKLLGSGFRCPPSTVFFFIEAVSNYNSSNDDNNSCYVLSYYYVLVVAIFCLESFQQSRKAGIITSIFKIGGKKKKLNGIKSFTPSHTCWVLDTLSFPLPYMKHTLTLQSLCNC